MAKVTIVNTETGEIVERDETPEEFAFRKKIAEDNEKLLVDKKAKEQILTERRQALLAKLGITEEEAKLLLS